MFTHEPAPPWTLAASSVGTLINTAGKLFHVRIAEGKYEFLVALYSGECLRRNINSCLRQVKAQCYTTLVRPNLEYAATVWDPYTKFNINKLEKCQRRAARFVNGDSSRESSVTK
jgi:hypothetical protein